MDTDLKLGKFHMGLLTNWACGIGCIQDRDMMFASTVDFRLSLDFFDSGLYTCTAVARLTLALAKLSCLTIAAGPTLSLIQPFLLLYLQILY